MSNNTSIPQRLLKPIRDFLEAELIKLKRQEKNIKQSDPFSDDSRSMRNSVEEDLDEQIGHFDSEVKASFVNTQIVQLRKVLTLMKLGKYGICQSCGKMIDTDRLAISPMVTVCIDCEREKER